MTTRSRTLLLWSTLAALSWLPPDAGWAQNYPVKVVRLVLQDFGGSDVLGRIIIEDLSQVLGQQVIIDHRPGANGIIAADVVAKAPPDGYTLLLVGIALAANASIYRNLPFDTVRDFAAVTQLVSSSHVVVVHPSLPVKSIADLVTLAKAKPGAINYGSAGIGSSAFLAAELFKGQAGVNMVHVPYKGGGAVLVSVIAGETSVVFSPVASSLPHIRQGRLRALAMTSAKRLPFLSELPTIAESGYPGYEFAQWYGLLAPARTPKETIATVRNAAATVLKTPGVSRRLIDLSLIPVGGQPEEFASHIKSEVEKVAKLARELHLIANVIK